MAKPIEPTPILSGEDARRFVRLTLEEEKHPNPKRIKFLQNCYALHLQQKS